MLSRYGDEIEADLRPNGIDILDLWRDTLSPRTLLNLIDHLPRTSAYQEALADDDELAAPYVDDDVPPAKPSMREFGPDVELLAAMYDRLGEVIQAVIGSAGGKPPNIQRTPRPETAIDRARRKARDSNYEALLAEIERAHERYEATH